MLLCLRIIMTLPYIKLDQYSKADSIGGGRGLRGRKWVPNRDSLISVKVDNCTGCSGNLTHTKSSNAGFRLTSKLADIQSVAPGVKKNEVFCSHCTDPDLVERTEVSGQVPFLIQLRVFSGITTRSFSNELLRPFANSVDANEITVSAIIKIKSARVFTTMIDFMGLPVWPFKCSTTP